MKTAALVPVVWSLFLAILAAMLWIWTPGDELAIAVLAGAAVGAASLGIAVALRRRSESEQRRRLLPDLSPATALLSIALTTVLIGLEAGPWLIWIGGGLCAIALAGLVRELRAERRER
jgi:hypothetical protein